LHLQQRDVVFQLQLALLQAPQLQLVVVSVQYQQFDDGVQIPMFDIELNQAPLYFLRIGHGRFFAVLLQGSRDVRTGTPAADAKQLGASNPVPATKQLTD
jgi:hypothetical protein